MQRGLSRQVLRRRGSPYSPWWLPFRQLRASARVSKYTETTQHNTCEQQLCQAKKETEPRNAGLRKLHSRHVKSFRPLQMPSEFCEQVLGHYTNPHHITSHRGTWASSNARFQSYHSELQGQECGESIVEILTLGG